MASTDSLKLETEILDVISAELQNGGAAVRPPLPDGTPDPSLFSDPVQADKTKSSFILLSLSGEVLEMEVMESSRLVASPEQRNVQRSAGAQPLSELAHEWHDCEESGPSTTAARQLADTESRCGNLSSTELSSERRCRACVNTMK